MSQHLMCALLLVGTVAAVRRICHARVLAAGAAAADAPQLFHNLMKRLKFRTATRMTFICVNIKFII